MKPIIEVENITKRYRYDTKRGITSLREEFSGFFSLNKKKKETFLALDNISFQIQPGESVGIIGSNGAGKSTLLKILSNVTVPTKGQAIIRGTVNSILEVGTGFHPDLTGRENIYFYGALQGISKKELERKFDEIIDFSGVEKFLDSPFRHYSSGMQVRLAFAIVSHLESDVLITDEVMAVGDSAFQKKSMRKMEEVFKQGKTIVFVSHQQSLVATLTQRCLHIEKGRLINDGPTKDVLKANFKEGEKFRALMVNDEEPSPGQYAKLLNICITDAYDQIVDRELSVSETYKIKMEFEILKDDEYLIDAVFQIKTPQGYLIFITNFNDFPITARKKGKTKVECHVPGNLLNVNQYFVCASLVTRYPYDIEHFHHENCLSFGIVKDPDDTFNFYGDYTGTIRPKPNWTAVKL